MITASPQSTEHVCHNYTAIGVYTVTVTIQDDDRGSGSASIDVVIADAATKITGGGYVVGPRYSFGFVAKQATDGSLRGQIQVRAPGNQVFQRRDQPVRDGKHWFLVGHRHLGAHPRTGSRPPWPTRNWPLGLGGHDPSDHHSTERGCRGQLQRTTQGWQHRGPPLTSDRSMGHCFVPIDSTGWARKASRPGSCVPTSASSTTPPKRPRHMTAGVDGMGEPVVVEL